MDQSENGWFGESPFLGKTFESDNVKHAFESDLWAESDSHILKGMTAFEMFCVLSDKRKCLEVF